MNTIEASTYFFLGSLANAIFTVLHIFLVVKPDWYRFFGAGELAELYGKGS